MNFLNDEFLVGCGRYLSDRYQRADSRFITVGIAIEYLRRVVGLDWTNQMAFGQHSTVAKANRDGRAFMRAESDSEDERYRWQERTTRLAELLFNLQTVEGIEGRVNELRVGKLQPTYAELECGHLLFTRGVKYRYVTATGQKGLDYDAEILLRTGKINVEMKCKIEGTSLSPGAIKNSLKDARTQLPRRQPGVVFLKIPERWTFEPETERVVTETIHEVLRGTTRIAAVVVRWEEVDVAPGGEGARISYLYRIEREACRQVQADEIDTVVAQLDGPPMMEWVSFRAIADVISNESV